VTEEEERGMAMLKVTLLSNKAACQMKLKDARGVVETCERILKLDPKHGKALFRMGQAQGMLGETKEALHYLEQAKGVNPTDLLIVREIQTVKEKERSVKENERKMYGRLFQ